MNVLFILYMAAAARMSGGGIIAALLPERFSFLPEIAFGLGFGWGAHQVFGGFWLPLCAAAWSYGWMETGHGVVLQWGNRPEEAQGKRRHTLSPAADFLARAFGFEIGGRAYCRLFMALKGFLIGLPAGGIPLAVLWPLAYESRRLTGSHALAEALSGVFAALAVLLFLHFAGSAP